MMIVIEVRLPRQLPRLKNTSREFPNSLFDNLLSGEDQTITNLPYTVKSNHNLLSGEDQTVTNLPYTVKSNHNLLSGEDQTIHNLLTGEDQTIHKSSLR